MDDNKLQTTGFYWKTGIKALEIYPNPMVDRAIISFKNPKNERYRLSITDISGKVVYLDDQIYSDRIEISREGLNSGLYMLELKGPETFRSKIMIR